MGKRKNERLINKIKKATKERFNLTNGIKVFYQNITYFLINNYLASKTVKVDEIDILTVFDNLYINNEIIDNDNLQEYDHILTTREVNRIKKGEILLLNYYTTAGQCVNCRIFLDSNYNIGF